MPSDQSIYRKIQVVLDFAKSMIYNDKPDFIRQVVDMENPIFFSLQYNEDKDVKEKRTSIFHKCLRAWSINH